MVMCTSWAVPCLPTWQLLLLLWQLMLQQEAASSNRCSLVLGQPSMGCTRLAHQAAAAAPTWWGVCTCAAGTLCQHCRAGGRRLSHGLCLDSLGRGHCGGGEARKVWNGGGCDLDGGVEGGAGRGGGSWGVGGGGRGERPAVVRLLACDSRVLQSNLQAGWE